MPSVGFAAETANSYTVGETWRHVVGSIDHPADEPPIVMSLDVKDEPPSGSSVKVARTVNDVAAVADVPVALGVDERETPAAVSIVAVTAALTGEGLPASSICTAENVHSPFDRAVVNVQDSDGLPTFAITHVTSALPGLEAVTTTLLPISSPVRSRVGVVSAVTRSDELTPESDVGARAMPDGAEGADVSIVTESGADVGESSPPKDCTAVTDHVASISVSKVQSAGTVVTVTGPQVRVAEPFVAVNVTSAPTVTPAAVTAGVASAVRSSMVETPVSDDAGRSTTGVASVTGEEVELIAEVDPEEFVAVTPRAM